MTGSDGKCRGMTGSDGQGNSVSDGVQASSFVDVSASQVLVEITRRRHEERRKRANERTKEGEMAPALINANPVVHERKERPPRSQPDYNDAVADVIDAQEIFDILPFVVRKKDGFASLFAVVVVR